MNERERNYPYIYTSPNNERTQRSVQGLRMANEHLKRVPENGYNMGHTPQLGGMASWRDHLNQTIHHSSDLGAMKKELKSIIDYLYYYAMTKHQIYLNFAQDSMSHIEKLFTVIEDPEDREIGMKIITDVRKYAEDLQSGRNPQIISGEVSGSNYGFKP